MIYSTKVNKNWAYSISVCPEDYKLLSTPYRSPTCPHCNIYLPHCPGDGFCCLHLSTGQCCDNSINGKCDVECLKDDCHFYGGKLLQAHEIDKWLCEIPDGKSILPLHICKISFHYIYFIACYCWNNLIYCLNCIVVDCNPTTSTQWPYYRFADRCELCGDDPNQCRSECHLNRDGKCVRKCKFTCRQLQYLPFWWKLSFIKYNLKSNQRIYTLSLVSFIDRASNRWQTTIVVWHFGGLWVFS